MLGAFPFFAQAVEPTGPSQMARDAGMPYLRALAQAGQAYAQRDFAKALDKLDIADQIQQNIPDTWNMRGAIYAAQRDYDRAEDAFQKASRFNPQDFWAPYNLAELLLLEKKYAQAAAAFQKLAVYGGGHEELVQYKVVLSNLLAGNPDAAKPALDAMKFPSDTAAYYFAHAAWGFAHKNEADGKSWTKSGLKVFGVPYSMSFYDELAQAGWLPPREADGSVPTETDLTTLPSAAALPAPDSTP